MQDRGLFKMDTIGDAYVVAGFLPAALAGKEAWRRGSHALESEAARMVLCHPSPSAIMFCQQGTFDGKSIRLVYSAEAWYFDVRDSYMFKG